MSAASDPSTAHPTSSPTPNPSTTTYVLACHLKAPLQPFSCIYILRAQSSRSACPNYARAPKPFLPFYHSFSPPLFTQFSAEHVLRVAVLHGLRQLRPYTFASVYTLSRMACAYILIMDTMSRSLYLLSSLLVHIFFFETDLGMKAWCFWCGADVRCLDGLMVDCEEEGDGGFQACRHGYEDGNMILLRIFGNCEIVALCEMRCG